MARRRGCRCAGCVIWVVILGLVLVAVGLIIHSSQPAWYARFWYPIGYQQAINREAGLTELDPALLAAVIWRESDFDPTARSSRGAVGLTQVLPSTAADIAAAPNPPVGRLADLMDPEVNIAYGAWYLRLLIDRHGGSVVEGLSAYNAGSANLTKWKQQALTSGHAFQVPADVPFPETKAYVEDIMDAWPIYRRTYGDQLDAPT